MDIQLSIIEKRTDGHISVRLSGSINTNKTKPIKVRNQSRFGD